MSIMNKIKPLLLERFFDQIKSFRRNPAKVLKSYMERFGLRSLRNDNEYR